jgi:hypothetical protein
MRCWSLLSCKSHPYVCAVDKLLLFQCQSLMSVVSAVFHDASQLMSGQRVLSSTRLLRRTPFRDAKQTQTAQNRFHREVHGLQRHMSYSSQQQSALADCSVYSILCSFIESCLKTISTNKRQLLHACR